MRRKTFDEAYAPVHAAIVALVRKATLAMDDEASDADSLANQSIAFAGAYKDFTTTERTYLAFKKACDRVAEYKKKTTAAVDKREKTLAKERLTKSNVHVEIALKIDTKIAKDILEWINKAGGLNGSPWTGPGLNIKFSIPTDFYTTDGLGSVVWISKDQTTQLVELVKSFEYFVEQKKWTADMMKQQRLTQAPTAIVKPNVLNKITACVRKTFKDIPAPLAATGFDDVKDVFDCMLYHCKTESNITKTSNDYGLCELKVGLEGTEIVMGVPLHSLDGTTLSTKQRWFNAMPQGEFLKLVQKRGFYAKIEPGVAVVVPGHFAILSLVPDNTPVFGLRMLVIGGVPSIKESICYADAATKEDGETAHGKYGKLKTYYKNVINKLEGSADADIAAKGMMSQIRNDYLGVHLGSRLRASSAMGPWI